MSPVRQFLIPLAAIMAGLFTLAAQEPDKAPSRDPAPAREELSLPDSHQTYLKRVADKTFVHEAAQISFTIPDGWKETPPHRLNRKIDPRIISVLGIELPDREVVASIYWLPMPPDQSLSRWVRDTPVGGEYGEEYETLKTVYGKDRVTIPALTKSGPFDVYRINISGGPPGPEKYDGTLFAFAVESGGTTWLIKARVSYPRGDRAKADAWAMEVLQGFKKMPAAVATPAK